MHEDKRNHVHDVIVKSANVQSQEVTEQELRAINKLTLTPLQKEEVFTFKVAMCDNEIDREFEVFPLKTLQKMQLDQLHSYTTILIRVFQKSHQRGVSDSDNQRHH